MSLCAKGITVPAPTARPPAPPKPAAASPAPTDAEAEAAAALADEPKAEAAAPTTIDFACPMCDAQLHMPLAEAGKRTPCPECKRIIKVPEPEKRDPTNWRQTAPNLPSGAEREVEAAPEGAWGSAAAAATVSREALKEAGAIPTKAAPVPLGRRIVRYTLWSAGGVAALVLLVLGYLKWRDSRAEQGVDAAVAYAESDAGKAELGGAGRSAIYRLAGQYALRAAAPDSGKRARAFFEKGLQAATEAPRGTERDALLLDLAAAEVELGGKAEDVDAGRKVPWEDVQKDLRATLGDMQESEPKLEALRVVARRLAEQNEGARATALANALFSSPNGENGEALGSVGLELCAAGKSDQAEKVWKQVTQLYAVKDPKNRPPLAPEAVALATALGQPPPEPAKKSDVDAANALVGRAEGLARLKKWNEARAAAESAPTRDVQLRAYLELAAVALDDKKTAGTNDVAAAVQAAQMAGGGSPWLLLRLTRVGARAGVTPEALGSIAVLIPDASLRGRAQLAVLQARLADSKQAADPKLMDAVEQKTVAAWLARNRVGAPQLRFGGNGQGLGGGEPGVRLAWPGAERAGRRLISGDRRSIRECDPRKKADDHRGAARAAGRRQEAMADPRRVAGGRDDATQPKAQPDASQRGLLPQSLVAATTPAARASDGRRGRLPPAAESRHDGRDRLGLHFGRTGRRVPPGCVSRRWAANPGSRNLVALEHA